MTTIPAVLLALVGLVSWQRLLARRAAPASHLRLLLEATGAQAVVSTLAAVALVSCSVFGPVASQALAGAVPLVALGLAGPAPLRAAKRPLGAPLEVVALALALLLAFAARPAFERLRMAGDAGVYATRAIHHLAEGGLRGRILLRDRLPDEMLAAFDLDNSSPPNESERAARGRLGGYQPGTYLEPTDRSRFEFQFLPGWPMAMALWGGLFGLGRLFDVLPFLLALATGYFGLVLHRHARDGRAAFAVLALFATSPLLLFFARYSTAEVLLVFLFLFVLHFGAERTRCGLCLAAAGLLLLALSHSSVFLYAPLPMLLAVEARRRRDGGLAALAAVCFGVLLVSLPIALLASPRYMHDVYAYSFSFLPFPDPAWPGLAAVAVFYLAGLALALAPERRGTRRPRWAALRAWWPLVVRPLAAGLAVGTVLRAYQLGWTRQLVEGGMNVGAWTRRAQYAGDGWASLAHLNVVSMILATALVGLPLALAMALRHRGCLVASGMRGLLLAAVLLSLGIYTFLRVDTPFNYYASRYFLPVFVPSTLLLLGLAPRRLQPPRWLTALLTIAGLAFNLRYALPLLTARPRQRPLESVLALAQRLPAGEVLYVNAEPTAFATLAIPLASLRGVPVVRVSRANGSAARARAERHCAELGLERAFWLGPEPPQKEWPLAQVRLAELDAPEQIAYPTAFVEPTRTYYLSTLSGDCGRPGDRGVVR